MLPLKDIVESGIGNLAPTLFRFWDPERRSTRESIAPPTPDESRVKIGLALSSGAAKGLAHIGVIQVLEENGIEIAAIAGTSMGAYVGACWASGANGDELEDLAAEMTRMRDAISLIDPVLPPRKGFIRGEKIKRRLRKTVGRKTFAELKRKLLVVATELGTYEARVFSEGDVACAVHASLAIPGICVPVEIDGYKYVDGGVADPLPVQALLDAGMDKVIAVSVLPTVEELVVCRQEINEARRAGGFWGKVLAFLNRHLNYFAPGNVLDILRNSAMGAQLRVANFNAQLADVYLRPVVCSGTWHDYHNYRLYIEEGRAVAEANIDKILALIEEEEVEAESVEQAKPGGDERTAAA